MSNLKKEPKFMLETPTCLISKQFLQNVMSTTEMFNYSPFGLDYTTEVSRGHVWQNSNRNISTIIDSSPQLTYNNIKRKKTIKKENKPTMKDETSPLSLMSDLKSMISNLQIYFLRQPPWTVDSVKAEKQMFQNKSS